MHDKNKEGLVETQMQKVMLKTNYNCSPSPNAKLN